MATATTALNPNNTRSNDFRVVYSDTIGLQFNPHQTILTFSIAHDLRDPKKGGEEQVAVAMTPVQVKALAKTLTLLVENLEKQANAPIPFNNQVIENLQKALASQQTAPVKPET